MGLYLTIEEIMELSDEDLERYILERVNYLNSISKSKIFISYQDKVEYHKGFLGDNVLICPYVGFTYGYSMKDVDYVDVFKKLKYKYDVYDEEDFFMMVNTAISEYFGDNNVIKSSDEYFNIILKEINCVKEKGKILTDEEIHELFKDISINCFKNTGKSECVERSALLQNLLTIIGYESYVVSGSKIKFFDREMYHAFNVIRDGDSFYYLDSSICNFYNVDDDYLDYCNKRKISEEAAYDLLNGLEPMTFRIDGLGNFNEIIINSNLVNTKADKEKVLSL